MQGSVIVSLALYAVAFAVYLAVPDTEFTRASSVWLWVFIVVSMFGVIAGNVRMIAMMTLVTLLIEDDRRDRANGQQQGPHRVDLRGTVRQVRAIPGLLALIGFSCLNNFLGGAFMALMDAYGLSMMSVRAWGLLWGGLSALFIVGGLLVAWTGLTKKPLRLLLLVNLVFWSVTALFPLQASIAMLVAGMAVYMTLVPYAEAAEQTILQGVVPYERQGRLFGFAQSVEQAASPLTAFLMGPLTQLIFIPFMTDGAGARWIGGWFGTGPARGIALVFVLIGILGIALTTYALNSRYYRQLSDRYDRRDDAIAAVS